MNILLPAVALIEKAAFAIELALKPELNHPSPLPLHGIRGFVYYTHGPAKSSGQTHPANLTMIGKTDGLFGWLGEPKILYPILGN